MTRQRQDVAEGATALQAQRDIIIHGGMSAEQMAKIMVALSKQIADFQVEAMKRVDERCKEFQDRILQTFSDRERADSSAFRDPDFQFVVGRAQAAHVRGGDTQVGAILVELIADRSKQSQRTRTTLALNDAVETAATLTANEFAVLSAAFVLREVVFRGVNSLEDLSGILSSLIEPLFADLPSDDQSVRYLQAKQCLSILPFATPIGDVLSKSHKGVFATGFVKDEFLNALSDDEQRRLIADLLIICKNDADKYQIAALNDKVLLDRLNERNVSNDTRARAEAVFANVMSAPAIAERMKACWPSFARLEKAWETTLLQQVFLTPVGTAIAHANINRLRPKSFADLSVWVR